jgi:hypothetical protein
MQEDIPNLIYQQELKAWITYWPVQKLTVLSRKCGRKLSANLTLLDPLEFD